MKYLKLFSFLALTFLLVGCEALGIEITTVKGYWESNKFENGDYCTMRLDNDKFSFYVMATDSTYSEKLEGTWLCKDDTISLYTQEKGSIDIFVKKLTQNTMTLQMRDKDYLIMSRVPKAGFIEVLELKRGFWYFVYVCIMFVYYLWYCLLIWLFIWEALKWLGRMIKKLFIWFFRRMRR